MAVFVPPANSTRCENNVTYVVTETGLPLVRHPFIHYPDDPEIHGIEYQYMVGSEFMVAPVLDPGQEEVTLYLPAGE